MIMEGEKTEMSDPKIENLLELSLDVSEVTREKSENLSEISVKMRMICTKRLSILHSHFLTPLPFFALFPRKKIFRQKNLYLSYFSLSCI